MLTNSGLISNEIFSPANFPKAIRELANLCDAASSIPVYFKVEIVVSFLKSHSLKHVWIEANPALARMVTSGFLETYNLESLFDSYSSNTVFLTALETYIGKQLLTFRETHY